MNVSSNHSKNIINNFFGSCGSRYYKKYLSTVCNDFDNTCALVNSLIG